jgi:hypothetical protein
LQKFGRDQIAGAIDGEVHSRGTGLTTRVRRKALVALKLEDNLSPARFRSRFRTQIWTAS